MRLLWAAARIVAYGMILFCGAALLPPRGGVSQATYVNSLTCTSNQLSCSAPTGVVTIGLPNYVAFPAGLGVAVTNVTTGTSCTIDSTCGSTTPDYFVCIDLGTPGAFTINLPSSPAVGRTLLIKDCGGVANAYNITLAPASGDIDGAANYVINTNHQSLAVTYDGTQWEIN